MKRSNAAVRIPPNPPHSTNTNFKPVQIGAPSGGASSRPPVKPKRGVTNSNTPSLPKTGSKFFCSQDTLSDVKIKFSEPHSGDNQTVDSLGEWQQPAQQTFPFASDVPADKSQEQPLYENIFSAVQILPLFNILYYIVSRTENRLLSSIYTVCK